MVYLGKFILVPFLAFCGSSRTLHFGGLSLYFDNFLVRKTVGSRETPRDGLLVRRMLIRKNLEFSPRSFVRSFVRSSVPDFLKNRSLLFSETWQLVRTQKGGKNVPSAFLKKKTV